MRILTWWLLAVGLISTAGTLARGAESFEEAPIEYSRAQPDNRVSALESSLRQGETKLAFDEKFGYLPALLEKLGVSRDSQMLVFAKSSLQRKFISPDTPRAIYFTDDLYVGYCHEANEIEISTSDPKLGAVFYTLSQEKSDAPKLTRETQRCLLCHASPQTEQVPGLLVRSLFVGADGAPLVGEGLTRVDSTTPIEKRWGGWYVSGTHGPQWHHGNLLIYDRTQPKPWNSELGFNVTDLRARFDVSNYLTPHSDIVSLLVFEHQTSMHNLLTKANYVARQELHDVAQLEGSTDAAAEARRERAQRRINAAADALVRGLLFSEEARMSGPFIGTSGFADEFSQRGPQDSQGRSLREFDLQTRLFKYPCSFLIYSRTFDELPPAMLQAVAKKLHDELLGPPGRRYVNISDEDRQAIAEILRETKPEFWAVVARD